VSVAWQIVFVFLPVVNFWAFYRIRRLRRYLLFVTVPAIALAAYTYDRGTWVAVPYEAWQLFTPSTVISWALTGLAIYLVIIWSRQHNKQFDLSSTA
jgi:hypothetical protein